jgi:hypothetical protein
MKSDPQSDGSESPFLWTRGIAAHETLRYLNRNRVNAGAAVSEGRTLARSVIAGGVGVSVASQYRFLEPQSRQTIRYWDCTSRPRWTCEISASFST